MKTVLKINEKPLLDEGKILVKDYTKVKELTNLEVTNVANYGYVQVVAEDLRPENIMLGKTILGIDGNAPTLAEKFLEGTITRYEGDAISVTTEKFANCSELSFVSLPMCTYVGSTAFEYCSKLQHVNIPRCATIGFYAFLRCSNLTSISLPICSYIGSSAFQGCQKLEKVEIFSYSISMTGSFVFSSTPLLKSSYLGYYGSIYVPAGAIESFKANPGMYYCKNRITALDSVYDSQYIYGWEFASSTLTEIPQERINIHTVGNGAFYECSNLTSVDLPQCDCVAASAFHKCSNLTSISLPQCTYIGSSAFRDCNNLTSVDLPQCKYISGLAFANCTKLQSLYLNVSSVPTLYSSNAFTYTPLSNSSYLGYYGSIYVPYSLYEAFTQATNWSYYSNRFVSYSF